jgi:ADP-ribose pyrophosphatase
MIRPWQKVASTPLGNFRIFSVRSERAVSPRTGKDHEFYVIDCVNWVNVIALAPDNQLVMVEQYRHGTNTVELEIPGGMLDVGDVSPVAAGVRELREETGYEGEKARVIGEVFPNPAIMSNSCYTVLVENCRLKHAVEFDHGEDLLTRLVPAGDIPRLIAEGAIRHAIVVAALCHFDLWQRGVTTFHAR